MPEKPEIICYKSEENGLNFYDANTVERIKMPTMSRTTGPEYSKSGVDVHVHWNTSGGDNQNCPPTLSISIHQIKNTSHVGPV